MGIADSGALARLDSRERDYVQGLDPDERDIVVSTLLLYRRPDRLRAGDAVPGVDAYRLEDGATVRLPELAGPKPLVLVFGSFT